jgi:hypothetical protein
MERIPAFTRFALLTLVMLKPVASLAAITRSCLLDSQALGIAHRIIAAA